MSHFDIDRYAYLESPIHRFDPRAKLVSILVLCFSIVLLNDLIFLGISMLIAITLVSISRIPVLFLLRRLRWIVLFIFTVFIVLILTVPGTYIVRYMFLHISVEGLQIASMVSLKSLTVMLLIFPMVATVRFDNFIKSLEGLGVPNKLVQIIAFSYRYIFVVLNEMQRTLTAMESRGFKMRSTGSSIKVWGSAIGMLLVRSYERSERVYNSMVARGYSGRIKTMKRFRMTFIDWLKTACIIAVALLLHITNMIVPIFEVVIK